MSGGLQPIRVDAYTPYGGRLQWAVMVAEQTLAVASQKQPLAAVLALLRRLRRMDGAAAFWAVLWTVATVIAVRNSLLRLRLWWKNRRASTRSNTVAAGVGEAWEQPLPIAGPVAPRAPVEPRASPRNPPPAEVTPEQRRADEESERRYGPVDQQFNNILHRFASQESFEAPTSPA